MLFKIDLRADGVNGAASGRTPAAKSLCVERSVLAWSLLTLPFSPIDAAFHDTEDAVGVAYSMKTSSTT